MKPFRFIVAASLVVTGMGTARGQEADQGGVVVADERTIVGLTASVAFVDPEQLNKSFNTLNSILDSDLSPLSTVRRFGAFVQFSPGRDIELIVKAEYLGFIRSFSYTGRTTQDTVTATGSFRVSNERTFHVVPIGFGIAGIHSEKGSAFEAGVLYAFGFISERGSLDQFGEYSNSYQGSGMGGWISLHPPIPIVRGVTLAPEISFRYMILESFEDRRGRELSGLKINLSGFSLGLGVMVVL